jgi:hypothetical protein
MQPLRQRKKDGPKGRQIVQFILSGLLKDLKIKVAGK